MKTAATWYQTPGSGAKATPVCVTSPIRDRMFVVVHPSAYPCVRDPDTSLKMKFGTVIGAVNMIQNAIVTLCDATVGMEHRDRCVAVVDASIRTADWLASRPVPVTLRYVFVPVSIARRPNTESSAWGSAVSKL